VGVNEVGDARDVLGAYALDAVEPNEVDEIEALLARDPDAAAEADRLRGVAGLLALAEGIRPPPSLRDDMLASARARRAARPDGPQLARYGRETERALAVIGTLTPDDEPLVTVNGLSAQELVVHVAAVESLIVEALGGVSGHDDAPTEIDGRTAALLSKFARRPLGDAVDEWQRLIGLVRLHAGDPSRSVSWRGGELSAGDLLIARSFEVWTHGDDLRRARGEQLEPPDPEGLTLMSDLSVRWLPLGLELVGRARPGETVRLELTGPGGGNWTVPLGLDMPPALPEPVAVVRVDVVDWCLLAAERLPTGDVGVEVTGEESVAADLLAAAPAFSTL
jgi:uncharacterized protein (TIGR03083 family)